MRLEMFFEKFELFAEAPNAVGKMRKLILQLAIQGRLKSQADELAFPQVRLDSLGSWAQGCGFPIAEQGHADRPILFSKVSDMNLPGNEREILKTIHTIDEETAKRLRIKVHPPGTVIFPKIGGAIATNKRRVLVRPTAIDNNCSGIIPNKSCSTHWLFLVLSAIDFAEYQSGTSVPAVNQGALGEIKVSLPPIAEQNRVVAKVDELMALCDRLEAQQQERETRHAALARASLSRFAEAPTPANLDFLFHKSYPITPADLRKSILTLAVQGKLAQQDPNDEPADDLLTKIQAEKKRLSDGGELKADKKAWVNSSTNPPHDIPDTWCWVRLQDVFEISRGGSPRPAGDPRYFGGPIPWITVGEVTKDSSKYLTGTTTGLTEEGATRSRFINPGDLLLTNSGATLGVPKVSKIRGCMNDGVAVLRLFHTYELNDFAYLYLTHQTVEFRRVNQGMGQPNLNTPIIAGWFFPLPPLAEQCRIVAKVDQLMAWVDQLETQLTVSRTIAEKLMEAVIAELATTQANTSSGSGIR